MMSTRPRSVQPKLICTSKTHFASDQAQYRHDGGRRYHAFEEDQYYLPNDQIEAGRLDLQHYQWKLTFNGYSGRIPITPELKNVLDVGTGTGIWALEVAQTFPHLQVFGVDLSAIQPESRPSNCRFMTANVEHDWNFETRFDYIHARMLTMGIHDWTRFFKQSWDFLEPGGWLEVNETRFPQFRAEADDKDGLPEGPFMRWSRLCYEAALKAGINAQASEGLASLLEKQGFSNVERVDIKWPIGPWAVGRIEKKIGQACLENMVNAIPGIGSLVLQKQLGMSKGEVDQLCEEAIEDCSKHRFYVKMVLNRAQKPST